MRTTIITCTDGTKITINWRGTIEEITRFVFEYYGKTVEKICRGF